MDLEYLDPFHTALPHSIEGVLNEDGSHGNICVIEQSPAGMWLATGNTDGVCQIWDLLTSSVIHTIPSPITDDSEDGGEAKSKKNKSRMKGEVLSISWFLPKKTLLIAYANGLVSEWCITKKTHERSMNIGEATIILCCYTSSGAWLVVDESRARIIDEGVITLHEFISTDEPISAASLSQGNNTLILGNSKGVLTFLEASDLSFVGSQSEIGSAVVKICTHSHKSGILMTIHKDRSIRLFLVQNRFQLKSSLKFIDVINRSMWATAGFSHDGELAYGAVREKGKHAICLWELATGTIVKTLEGPREDLLDIRWHPKRPIVVSLSKFGTCYVWRPQYPKKWSALFPGMTEVEENVTYIEREDEFDEVQEETKAEPARNEDEQVDILTPLPCVTPEDLLEIGLFSS